MGDSWVDTEASNRARWAVTTRTRTHLGGRDTSMWHVEVLRASLPDGVLAVFHEQDAMRVLGRTLHLQVTETHSSALSQWRSLLYRLRGVATSGNPRDWLRVPARVRDWGEGPKYRYV